MENVTCALDIQPTDSEHIFGDGWDFTMGIYQFNKVSDTRVRVTFMYQDEVNRRDPDGVMVSGHDPWTDNYVRVEEELQTLLDVICFQTSGIGLKILPDSLEMRSSSMISHRSEQTHNINLRHHDDIQTRFETTIRNNNEKLLDALRLNRLAAGEENDGEKIGQLWGAVERLYASDPPRLLDTKEKRKELGNLIDQATSITDDDKKRLKDAINNTYKVSKPSVIAEKFGLINGDGEAMSHAEIKSKLDYWIGVRSVQSHGVILMRNEDVNMLASEMDHIMETALSGEIRPSKYVYVVYKPDDVRDFFEERRQATVKEHDAGYRSMPIHKFAAFDDMPQRLMHSLADENSSMFLVEYDSIHKITLASQDLVELEDLADPLKQIVEERMRKLN
ncbi:MAG: hypothetical protein QG629_195 [Patescibacteria group bacterium]|nr:hypothetical protein [Candidatus Saccharibacteria bacterium]MDQ5963113.1 hypothetical protein [Patescibacteria group bacterium]